MIRLLGVVVVVGLASGCGGDGAEDEAPAPPETSAPAETAPPPADLPPATATIVDCLKDPGAEGKSGEPEPEPEVEVGAGDYGEEARITLGGGSVVLYVFPDEAAQEAAVPQFEAALDANRWDAISNVVLVDDGSEDAPILLGSQCASG